MSKVTVNKSNMKVKTNSVKYVGWLVSLKTCCRPTSTTIDRTTPVQHSDCNEWKTVVFPKKKPPFLPRRTSSTRGKNMIMHTKASTEHLPGMTTSSTKLSINGPSIKSSSINESPSINTTPTPMDYSSIPRNPSNNTFSPLIILESECNEPIHNSDNISSPSMLLPKHLIPQPSFVKGHVEPMVIINTNSKPIDSCPSTNSKNNPDKSALPDVDTCHSYKAANRHLSNEHLAQSCSQVKHAHSMQNNKPIPSSNILTQSIPYLPNSQNQISNHYFKFFKESLKDLLTMI